MADWLQLWFSDLVSRREFNPLKIERDAWGDVRYGSNHGHYARLHISIAPSSQLEIIDRLGDDKSVVFKRQGFHDQIVFGVLDITMTALSSPIRTFRLTILDAEYHDIDSSPIDFRMAARQAATTILMGDHI